MVVWSGLTTYLIDENQTLWCLSLTLLEKAISHWSHLKGLSIVWWCLMWSNNSASRLTLWSQKSHLKDFSICLFNLWLFRNFAVCVTKSHWSQRCSSPLCFCMWFLRLVFVKHLWSQISQIYFGSPWCNFKWFQRSLEKLWVDQTQAILFLKSMSERVGSDIERPWIWMTIDLEVHHSISASLYVGFHSFRQWFQK